MQTQHKNASVMYIVVITDFTVLTGSDWADMKHAVALRHVLWVVLRFLYASTTLFSFSVGVGSTN